MNIKQADKKDLQVILELQYLAYQSEARLLNNPHIPPLEQTLDQIQEEYDKGIILKALDEENNIIGSVRAYSEGETLFIGKLFVHPDMQGRGIGKELLRKIECSYPGKRCELFTSSSSKRNINLYIQAGYKTCCEKRVSEFLNFVYLEKFPS